MSLTCSFVRSYCRSPAVSSSLPGVMGSSRMRLPVASNTALATAAATPVADSSPIPLAPSGPRWAVELVDEGDVDGRRDVRVDGQRNACEVRGEPPAQMRLSGWPPSRPSPSPYTTPPIICERAVRGLMIFPALYTPVARRSRSNPSCGSTPTSTNMTPKVRVEVAASPAALAGAFPGKANAPSPASATSAAVRAPRRAEWRWRPAHSPRGSGPQRRAGAFPPRRRGRARLHAASAGSGGRMPALAAAVRWPPVPAGPCGCRASSCHGGRGQRGFGWPRGHGSHGWCLVPGAWCLVPGAACSV